MKRMIEHPDCHWCLSSTEDMCDICVNEMHIDNRHTPTSSLCMGIICLHNEPIIYDGDGNLGIKMGEHIQILNDDWIKNLKEKNEVPLG